MSDFRDKFAIVGIGWIVGRTSGYSPRTLQVEAARRAIEDAGLRREDIDGCVNARLEGGAGSGPGWTDAFPRILGLPAKFYYTVARGGAMVPLCIASAAKFLELGLAHYVMIACGINDYSRRHRPGRESTSNINRGGLWGEPLGELAAVSHHSFFASRHMYEYGTTSEQLGAISVAERQWACGNPDAQMYGRPITLEDHQKSAIIVWPYHLLDMCLVSDGGVAFILTTADRAKNLRKRPVYIMGIGFGEAMEKLWWEKANYTRLAVETAKASAFQQAGIKLGDVDVAALYDCFTSEVLFQLEDYGWCKKGEGGPFVAKGHIAPGGSIPVNTGGGLLSAFHLGDFTHLIESVIQLRGEGGDRQVKDAEIILVTGHGGEILRPGMCSIHSTLILRR